MFTVHVAADIFSNKVNFELSFLIRPNLAELTQSIESAFTAEINVRRPDNVPQHNFCLSKLKVYDEKRSKWSDLKSESKLTEYCQVYAFQPENPWHKESPKEIPVAVKPPLSAIVSSFSNISPGDRDGGAGSHRAVATAASLGIASVNTTTCSNSSLPVRRETTAAQSGKNGLLLTAPTSIGTSSYSANAITLASDGIVGLNSGGNVMRPSPNASVAEKIRVVFNEFDIKNARYLDTEDMRNGFRELGFEFTTTAMNDLFQKTDTRNNGCISYSDFEHFGKSYPIFLDCLYYRSKAFWDEESIIQDVNMEKENTRQAVLALVEAEAAHLAATKASDDATHAVQTVESDIQELNLRLHDISGDASITRADKERSTREKQECEKTLQAVRDRARTVRQVHSDCMKEIERGERKVQVIVAEADKAEEHVAQLQQELLEAQRAAERCHANVRQTKDEVDSLKIYEREAASEVEDATQQIPLVERSVQGVDSTLQNITAQLHELEGLHKELTRNMEEAQRRRALSNRAAQITRESEDKMEAERERTRKVVEDKERIVKAKEASLLEAQRQRKLVTPHEKALIEQELRLREQRETLEEKENRLKSEAGSYLANLRTNATSQSMTYSRSVSTSG